MLQITLAKAIGVSGTALSKIESGLSKAPAAATLLKIAAVFEANPEWIMHGTGQPFEIQNKATQGELAAVFSELTPDKQAMILAAAKALL